MSDAAQRGEPTWPSLLTRLLRREDLSAADTAWAMEQVMRGDATPTQVAGFAVALRAKGESPDEVTGMVRSMLGHAVRIDVPGPTLDVVGTGGDLAHTVNISTMAAIVAAAAGARVVKHGNRAASSSCGAADVLEELGVVIDLTPDQVVACAEQAGITFCFAPLFHPSLRHTAVPRRELGVPTVFNFLGPLANPSQPVAQAVGVFDQRMAAVVAQVFAARGVSALVFRGQDGLDELSTAAPSRVWAVRAGTVSESVLDPADLGIRRSTPDALRGADAAFNAAAVRSVLAGDPGPVRDAVLLNAAGALAATALTEAPLVEQLAGTLAQATAAVDSGAGAATLERWVATSRALAGR